jgi:hypothetical protein
MVETSALVLFPAVMVTTTGLNIFKATTHISQVFNSTCFVVSFFFFQEVAEVLKELLILTLEFV